MTDRELLEAAAKAAGINLDLTLRPDGKPLGCSERGLAIDDVPGWWNPLTSDADALRLAVRLRLTVKVTDHGAAAYKGDLFRLVALDEATTVETATRRAIVRAAAEIGKGMK